MKKRERVGGRKRRKFLTYLDSSRRGGGKKVFPGVSGACVRMFERKLFSFGVVDWKEKGV